MSSTISLEWPSIIPNIFLGLVDKNGTQAKELIMEVEREDSVVKKAKYSRKSINHRAEQLLGEII